MDNNSNDSSPSSPAPSTAPEAWSTCNHPEDRHHDFSNDRMQSPQCSEVDESNEDAYSQHQHHFKVEPQDDCKVVDYSQSHLPQPTSSSVYDPSEAKSPVPSDMVNTSINHSRVVQYEDRLEMYEQDGEDDPEIPSTTTDHSQDELDEHEVKHYKDHQQPSTSSSVILKSSDPYSRHQHIEPFSPQQPPTSSTNGYQVGMDNYDGVSPMDSYHNSPAPEISDRMHYRIDDPEDGNLEIGSRSSPNEASIPVSVSSSDIMSSSDMLDETSSANKHIVHIATESQRFPSSLDEVGSINDVNESHQNVSPDHLESHQLVQQELPTMSLHQGSSLDPNDPTIRYYSPDSFDPNLVRLVNQRFPTLMTSGMASVSSPKELYVDSVVTGMMNSQSGRLYQELQGNGVLEEVVSARLVEDPDEVKEIVASSLASEVLTVDQNFPIVRMTGTLHVDSSGHTSTILDEQALASLPSGSRVTTVLTDSLPHGLLTISPGNVPLELVGGNILVGRSIVGHHMPSSSHTSHPVCEVTSGIMNSLNCLPNIITTTAVIRERELASADSLVQVSHISEATPIQSYVSSSTSGLDHDSHIPSHTIILDATVDSTVGTSDPHLGHTKGLVGSSNEHYAMEMEHQEAVALKYSSDIDVDHYSSVITDQEDNLDSGQGVSTTAEELSQESGVLLISSDDSRLGNSVTASSTSVVTMNVHRVLADSIDPRLSSSIASDSLMSTTSIPDNQTIATSRPRRSTNKQRGSSKTSDGFENGSYCDECTTYYESECPKHRVQSIFDKPVLTRAWASLPASYLSINKVAVMPDGIPVYGVFAKKSITKRTQFGPLEGVTVKREDPLPLSYGGSIDLVLQIESETGELLDLDTTDECLSNWMRFVRPAENYREQNLVIVQHGQSLCYTTVRNILPRTELKVGYSPQYATRRGLAIWEPDEEMRAEEEQENSWPCFECSKKFLSSEELQQHLNEHDSIEVTVEAAKDQEMEEDSAGSRKRGRPKGKVLKKTKGRLPSKKFKSTGSSNDDEFKCGQCQKVFPRQYSLQRHLAMHSGEKKFKCSVCELKFTHVYNRNRHMRKHRAPALGDGEVAKKAMKCLFKKKVVSGSEWSCTHCNLTFDKSSLFNLHTLTHAAENIGLMEFPEDGVLMDKGEELREPCFENGEVMISEILECPQCTQAFSTKKELIDHASTHGKVVTPRKSFRGIINPAKPHKCELCYKSFATEDRLLRHMLVHGNEEAKPLKCSVCEKRFLNNSALACHVKVHSDAKSSYECPICKEEFDQIVALKEHIKIHSINGLFTCPTCQRNFEEYNQIRKHIRAFHSEKKFPCEHCDKIFPRPDKLKLHMLRHSNHREFLCANCGKQFKRKDKLKEHMKRMHSAEREARLAMKPIKNLSSKKFIPKVSPTDYHRFIYKCHACLLGFKRRGMLVNHLAKRHPDIRPDSVPELNLPILKTTRDYYCQYCEKVYKSSSKRKAHILKQHPGAELPMSNRRKGGIPEIPGLPNPTFSQTVGSITTHPHNCEWCHKQYASKAKLLQHQRKKHFHLLPAAQQVPRTHYRDAGPQDDEQYITVPANLQQQIAEGGDLSEIQMEYDEAVVIEDSKSNLVATTNIYIEREDGSPTVVVTASDMTNQSTSVEALPPADLLTQAMSELTQSLTDYRVTACTHEYDLTRVTQSCPPSVVVPSPSSSPIPQPSSTPSHVTLEQTQLGRLLGHYDGGEEVTLSNSPQPEGIANDASVFVPRTWPSSYSDYPAR